MSQKSRSGTSDKSLPNDITCPKCGSPLAYPVETATGKKFQRCSTGNWDPKTRQTTGCDFIKWLSVEPKELDEKCPKCGSSLILQVTRFGKKLKKCSTGGWDKDAKKPTGCDYVEWLTGTTEPFSEKCPKCGSDLVLYTTTNGKRMIKCSTSGWDRVKREATGCTYIKWLNSNEKADSTSEESFPLV